MAASTGSPPAVRWPVPETPYGRQPWRALYFAWIFVTVPLLVPVWTAQYFLGLHPHPPFYSLYESLWSRINHRLYLLVSQAAFFAQIMRFGDGPGEVAPAALNTSGKLKRSRVQWIEPPAHSDEWFKGHSMKEGCEPARIAAVTWGKPGRGPPREDLVVGPNETVFLHLHGGGFTTGNATESFVCHKLALQVIECDAVDYVLSPEYRQLDQGPWPMPLVDCVTAYAYLVDPLRVPPCRVLVGGDSAGGCLALALLRYLRGEVEVVRPDHFRHSPYLSPASSTVAPTAGLFARFPPSFILARRVEHFVADIRELVRRLELGGVECEYVEQLEAPHDFSLLEWWAEAKKKDAVERMQAWVDEQFK